MIKLKRTRDRIHPDFTSPKLFTKLIGLVEARIPDGEEMEFKGAIGDWKKNKDMPEQESYAKCADDHAAVAQEGTLMTPSDDATVKRRHSK